MKKILLLGATGSVGGVVLDIMRRHPDRFRLAGAAAKRGGGKLAALCREFSPEMVSVADPEGGEELRRVLAGEGSKTAVLTGPVAAPEMVSACGADVCVAAVSGTAGLEPTFAAARRGMRVLLANKEVLVSAGRLFLEVAAGGGAEILPLDSEHSALFQCLEGRSPGAAAKAILTASGGPFRGKSREEMARVSVHDALSHPVWRMGAKITVDSATMANKALEVIEAHHLFGLPYDDIEVLIHPQAVVHGIVEFRDGSCVAHMGVPDMLLPVQYAMFHPERKPSGLARLNLAAVGRLTFEAPDRDAFPLLDLGVAAGRDGDGTAAAFNAANEAAVSLFLESALPFSLIHPAVAGAVDRCGGGRPGTLEDVMEIHRAARECVEAFSQKQNS